MWQRFRKMVRGLQFGLSLLLVAVLAILSNDSAVAFNDAEILQDGNDNQLHAEQFSWDSATPDLDPDNGINLLSVLQSGAGNLGYLQQQGAANRALIVQEGKLNSLDVLQAGAENLVELEQLGRSNRADIRQDGDFHFADIFQFGEENAISLNQFGQGRSFNITQQGDGLEVSVTQEGF